MQTYTDLCFMEGNVTMSGSEQKVQADQETVEPILDDLLEIYHELRETELAYAERREKIASLILSWMGDLREMKTRNYRATVRGEPCDVITEDDVPPEVWKRYKKTVTRTVVDVVKNRDEGDLVSRHGGTPQLLPKLP